MCHVAFDKSKGVNIGLQNYGKDDDDDDIVSAGMQYFLQGNKACSDSNSDNEVYDDDNMPDLYFRNHEDIDSSFDEVEGKSTRAPISRKNTGLLKDAVVRLDGNHYKVAGVNDHNYQDAKDVVVKSRNRFSK